jgi:hypothetical protein
LVISVHVKLGAVQLGVAQLNAYQAECGLNRKGCNWYVVQRDAQPFVRTG